MENNIKLILTDIGGVIFKSTGMRKAISNFLHEDIYSEKVQMILDLFLESFIGKINEQELREKTARIANVQIEDTYKLEDSFEYTINYNYIKYLKNLSKNYKIGIISDINSLIFKLVKDEIDDFNEIFDENYIFLSYIEKDSKHKSGNKFFNAILEKTQLEACQILFIDDKIEILKVQKKAD